MTPLTLLKNHLNNTKKICLSSLEGDRGSVKKFVSLEENDSFLVRITI